jgi:hypothetical protein
MEPLYTILSRYAEQRRILTYGDLTADYQRETTRYVSWRDWGEQLGELNRHLCIHDYPAISVVVVLSGSDLPSYGFWGCSPNVPEEPETDQERREIVQRIREEVFATQWPMFLPPE